MSFPLGARGRARVNPRSPRAFAICDRCGQRTNHEALAWQFEWRGRNLQNLKLLVCRSCTDIPQQQMRAYSPPPDPVPIRNPRPDMSAPAPTQLYVESGGIMTDENGNVLVPEI